MFLVFANPYYCTFFANNAWYNKSLTRCKLLFGALYNLDIKEWCIHLNSKDKSQQTDEAMQIAALLHEYERAVLPVLATLDPKVDIARELATRSSLDEVQISRALQWLSNKKLIDLSYTKKEYIVLDKNGEQYRKIGLPEKLFLKVILDGKAHTLSQISYLSQLSEQEITLCLGLLKSKQAIITDRSDLGIIAKITPTGVALQAAISPEEVFLKGTFPIARDSLTAAQKTAADTLLRRRQIIAVDRKQFYQVNLTNLGRKVAKLDLSQFSAIGTLTPAIIKSGEWKTKPLRRFDIESKVPAISIGRVHPLTQVINEVRRIFLEMGFSEMKGPWVETAFWCMDSMWIPQDHPARDVQDTFFLNKTGSLPNDKRLVDAVKDVHENGGDSGSKGYGYTWSPQLASQLILRTHTTATTYRQFGQHGVTKGPAKYFYVGKVFRNEAIDATHLPEFYQVEGFVMADGLNLSHLLGFIKEFYAKLGFDKIKFKVTYNPYTESSVEALAYDEKHGKWMELINSGIFRPESLAPYGIKQPVIAWGMGLERLAMLLLGANKLKDIVGPTSDLQWLRTYQEVIPQKAKAGSPSKSANQSPKSSNREKENSVKPNSKSNSSKSSNQKKR